MARKPRIEYPGALVHVMSRGNRGDRVFLDDDDRDLWLKTLGQACEKTGWWVHAYVLMDNRWIAEHLEMGHPVSIPKETRKIGEIHDLLRRCDDSGPHVALWPRSGPESSCSSHLRHLRQPRYVFMNNPG